MAARVANWSARHGHALLSTARQLSRQRLATTLTVLVIALALALPLALYVLVQNVRAASGDLSEAVGLSVYLKHDVSEQQARELAARVRARSDVASVTLISAAQALQQFKQQSGFGAALDALTDNPLPSVLDIRPSAAAMTAAQLEALRAQLAAWPQADSVQLDRDWIRRFEALVALVRGLLLLSAVLLGAGIIAVVGNTVRLEIQSRRAEIEVTKLVGGSNAFVRRPFLYAGALYGLTAALIAWGIVEAARAALAAPVATLAAAYGTRFMLQGLTLREVGIVLCAGVLLGWLGAALAASGQLSRIEPRAG